MKSLPQLLLLLTLSFASFEVRANVSKTGPCGDIIGDLEKAIDRLESIGINKLDGKSLRSLRKAIPTFTVITVPFLFNPSEVSGTYRSSARWDRDTRVIEFSEHHCAQINPFKKPYLLLHEFGGPLGIEDDSFGRTAAAATYEDMLDFKKERPELFEDMTAMNVLKDYIESPSGDFSRSGGVTVVEGGGDGRVLGYMLQLQRKLFAISHSRRIPPERYNRFLAWIGLLRIEFMPEISQGELVYVPRSHTLLIPDRSTNSTNIDATRARIEIFLNDLLAGKYFR